MRKLFISASALAAILVLSIATGALAAKPIDCDDPKWEDHPSCTTTTTSTTTTTTTAPEDPLWTCQRRIDNGATAWVPGLWIGADGAVIDVDLSGNGPLPERYRADTAHGAIPACVDIHPGHFSATSWTVAWRADDDTVIADERGKSGFGGLLMVFEREVHDVTYDESIARTTCGEWTANLPDGGVDNLVYVAMPSRRDGWGFTDGYLELTPAGPSDRVCPEAP